jgi:release factor glutamine methyltransferase
MNVREALREGRRLIEALGSDEAELEAELLLRHTLGLDRVHLYQRLDDALTDSQAAAYRRLLDRRLAHEPVAYITGHREFFGLEFEVSPAAIIPRPETETLVELALAFARECFAGRPITIVDVGVGAGTIAIPLAREIPKARVVAIDISREALTLAGRNAERHGVAGHVDFREGDLLAPFDGRAEIITANLPYVTSAQWEAMPPEIREHEPRSGLDGGVDGLDLIRRLLDRAPSHLAPGGALLCEIGDWQGEAAQAAATAAFPGARVVIHSDLAGRDRVLAVYA